LGGLTLWQFLQLRDERLWATGEITVELPHLLAVAVQYDDGGKSKNFELLGQLNVLLFFLRWLGFSARKIEFDQNEIVVREVFELRLRENVLVEFDAPPAPVRTRKIEEKEFVVRFRLFLRLAEIAEPIGFRSREGGENKGDCGCDEK
jgi:hypothetical protein